MLEKNSCDSHVPKDTVADAGWLSFFVQIFNATGTVSFESRLSPRTNLTVYKSTQNKNALIEKRDFFPLFFVRREVDF